MGSDVLGGFLKGFAAGYALMQSKDEREYAKAKTEYTKAMAEYYKSGGSRASSAARDANYASMHEDRVERRKEVKRHNLAMENKEGKSTSTDVGLGDPELTENLDIDESTGEEFYDDPVSTEAIPEPEPIPEYSHGGPVRPPKKRRKMMRYANGGGVVQEEDPPVPIPPVVSNAAAKQPMGVPPAPPAGPGWQQPKTAQEMNAVPQQGIQTPPTAMPEGGTPQTPPGIGFSVMAGYDAAVAGVEQIAKDNGLDKDDAEEAVPTEAAAKPDKKVEKYNNDTKDMASPDQVEALRQKFDPQKKLSMDQVNMKVLGGVFEGYLKMGDPAKATKAAADLVKYYRTMYNRYMSVAQAAAKGGKVDDTIRAILGAYAYVPDGMEAELQKTKDGRFAYRYTDHKTGKVVARGLKTPDEILSLVTHGGIGTFEQLLDQAAGDPSVKAFEERPSPAALKGLGLEGAGPEAGAVGVPTSGLKNMTEAKEVAEHNRRTNDAANARVDAALPTMDGTQGKPFRVTSQAELDRLPPGTWVSIDGRVGQKQAPKAAK